MQPRKTELARLALQSHAAPLAMRERQALILCDGRRDVAELDMLLGAGTSALIDRLCAAGYLSTTEMAVTVTVAVAAAVAPAADAASLRPTSTTQTERRSPAISRRSIVAAKLYIIGMLELQRHESAVSQRMRLQACQDPDATVAHILAAVHCLQRTTSPSFAQRVRERLAEVLPEDYLPTLETLELEPAPA